MRRRLTAATVGMVVAALLLVGVGTTVLTAVNARADTEADLRETVESLSELIAELTIMPDAGETGRDIRARLQALADSLSVDGIGLLVLPRNRDPIGSLPDGLTVEDLDAELLRAGETQSNRDGDLLWAARGNVSRNGTQQVVVMTDEPDPLLMPSFRWFLLASLAAIVVAALIAGRVSRSLTGPIRASRDVARRIAAGDLDARIPDATAAGRDEVGELVASINSMAANLQRSNALERQFLMSVSHDLRTPLTSIKGYAEALADGAIADQQQAGRVIETEADRLERLVGDLLLLARLESTDFPLDRRTVALNDLVDATVTGLQHEARGREVTLTARIADTPLWADLDADRYGQIIGNLVGNALRFADREVVVTLWSAEGGAHLSVGDDGPGIAEADLPHVFERLYVAEHNPAVQESGSGLGLAIVRDLTERMGGSVTARRSSLGGAEFVVSFAPAPPPTP